MSPACEALKKYFGYDGFLDHQEPVVEAMIAGRELCVVMPTGAGKSLCYQLPILLRPGYGIVVSPLIALMKDQVDGLLERNIPAAFINSSISFGEQRNAAYAAASGAIKLLYVAPERFSYRFLSRLHAPCPPSTLVVDEAHCIKRGDTISVDVPADRRRWSMSFANTSGVRGLRPLRPNWSVRTSCVSSTVRVWSWWWLDSGAPI